MIRDCGGRTAVPFHICFTICALSAAPVAPMALAFACIHVQGKACHETIVRTTGGTPKPGSTQRPDTGVPLDRTMIRYDTPRGAPRGI